MTTSRIGRMRFDTGRVDAQPPKQPVAKRHRPFEWEVTKDVSAARLIWRNPFRKRTCTCGGNTWFSRVIPMGYCCEDCGKEIPPDGGE